MTVSMDTECERETLGEYKLEITQGREGGNLIKFQNIFIGGKTTMYF